MSSPYRSLAGGIPDEPLRFLERPDYDEAYGPPNRVYRYRTSRDFRVDWKVPKKKKEKIGDD